MFNPRIVNLRALQMQERQVRQAREMFQITNLSGTEVESCQIRHPLKVNETRVTDLCAAQVKTR